MSTVISSPVVQGAVATIVVAVAAAFGQDWDSDQILTIVGAVAGAAAFAYSRVTKVPKQARGFKTVEDPLAAYVNSD